MAVNKVILIGNVGRDPETRTTQSGSTIAKFSVATSERFGEGKEKTDWHNVTAFGKLAEIVSKYVSKGSQVCVIGRINYSSWDGNDGQKKYRTEIVAGEIELIGGKRKDNAQQQSVFDKQNPSGQPTEDDMPW